MGPTPRLTKEAKISFTKGQEPTRGGLAPA